MPKGGLMVSAEIVGGNIPLENIESICQTLEKYCILPYI